VSRTIIAIEQPIRPKRGFSVPNVKADPLREVALIWAEYDAKVDHLRDERAKLEAPKTTAWWRGHRLRQLAYWLRRADAERFEALAKWVGTQLVTLDREPTADDLRLFKHLCERPDATREETSDEPRERTTPPPPHPTLTHASVCARHTEAKERSEPEPLSIHPRADRSATPGPTLPQTIQVDDPNSPEGEL
jgi:hypothetical protein